MLTNLRKFSQNWTKFMELPMIVLGFVFLGLYTLEVLSEPGSTAFNLAVTGSFIIYLLFAFDLLTTLIAEAPWENKDSGWRGFFSRHWLLILAVALPMFRPLRIFRLLLVLSAIESLAKTRASQASIFVVVALPLVWFTGALSLFDVERGANASFQSLGDALWWSAVTITTVGYGDYAPITLEGRVVAIFLMLLSIGLIGSVTALLANWVFGGQRERH